MAKNVLRDIMTNEERRTIRRIPLPAAHIRKTPLEDDFVIYRDAADDEEPPTEVREGFGIGRGVLWGAAFIFLMLLGFAVATGFSGATVTVTPKTALVEVNHEFVASRLNTAKIALETASLRETAESVIPADTTKNVSERASGRIIVYNNYSEKPQRLIKNTRFADPEGLVYRISESIVVPGYRRVDSKVIPGSIETAVYADSPGKEYNIGLSDFTVPGFKTDAARYGGFYARSKTPMEGGFDGVQRVPSDDAIAAARSKLREDMSAKLREKAAHSVPEGFVLYDGALGLSFESVHPIIDGEKATIRETVVATTYLINEADLKKAIAERALPTQAGLPVDFPDIAGLRFTLNEQPREDRTAETLRFKLTGGVRAVWQFDRDKLEQSLLGKQKGDLASVLSAFPTIEKVDLIVRPFWKRSFPTDPAKMDITDADVDQESNPVPDAE